MCFYLSVYPHWRSMVNKQFIAPIQGSGLSTVPVSTAMVITVSGVAALAASTDIAYIMMSFASGSSCTLVARDVARDVALVLSDVALSETTT